LSAVNTLHLDRIAQILSGLFLLALPEMLYPEINVISSERRVLARVEKSCGLPKNTRSLHSALE
jgi:hypothetical protein